MAWSRYCDTRRRKSELTVNTNFDLNRRASPRPYLREAGGAIPSAYSPNLRKTAPQRRFMPKLPIRHPPHCPRIDAQQWGSEPKAYRPLRDQSRRRRASPQMLTMQTHLVASLRDVPLPTRNDPFEQGNFGMRAPPPSDANRLSAWPQAQLRSAGLASKRRRSLVLPACIAPCGVQQNR